MWESDDEINWSGSKKRLQKWTSQSNVAAINDDADQHEKHHHRSSSRYRPPPTFSDGQHAVSLGDLPLLLAAAGPAAAKKPPLPPPRRENSAPPVVKVMEFHDDSLVAEDGEDALLTDGKVSVVHYVVEMPDVDPAAFGDDGVEDMDAYYGWEEDDEEMVITEVQSSA